MIPLTDQAAKILNSFRQHRSIFGIPDSETIRKMVERTDTRHYLPQGWIWK